jgi:hypothetical protein
MAVKINLGNS